MTNVRRERIPLLRITVREIDLAKCLTLSVNMGGCEVPVCLHKSEAVWKGCSQCDRQRIKARV